MVKQVEFTLPAFDRGMHLITNIVKDAVKDILPEAGLLHLFVKHTSAALTLNENADPSVRYDMENFMSNLVPDGWGGFTHTDEGPDDMPSHIKSSMFGSSITIPVTAGRLNLGIWQGIYLYEFRNYRKRRTIVATVIY